MKIYEFVSRDGLQSWLEKLPYEWRFGYGRPNVVFTPFEPVGEGWNRRAGDPIVVPVESFVATGESEAEACMKLALRIEEYLAARPEAKVIRVSSALRVDSEKDFDFDRRKYRATMALFADARFDAAEAERAKRAE